MTDYRDTLRTIVRVDGAGELPITDAIAAEAAAQLGGATHALVRVAALIAVDAAPSSYLEAVEVARRWDVTDEQIVGCLIALLPTVGVARVVSAAPKLGLALGYDVDAALEGR